MVDRRARLLLWIGLLLLPLVPRAYSEELTEYRLKAAFLYNFALFTEWPASVGDTLNVCIHGEDPFGAEIDALQGSPVGNRRIVIRHKVGIESLHSCQMVFFSSSTIGNLPHLLPTLRGAPVLTVADSSGATRQGVALNMTVVNDKVVFQANVEAARNAKVTLSSKLLRLASEVYP
jgi:YfiR/HmsC-like